METTKVLVQFMNSKQSDYLSFGTFTLTRIITHKIIDQLCDYKAISNFKLEITYENQAAIP